MVDGPGLVSRMARAERLGITSGLATVLSGLGLIVLTTGFNEAPLKIYFGLAAALAMIVVGATMARPAWQRVKSAIGSGSAPTAAAAVKPFNRALALESLLWVFALVAMVI